ncbi:hypothetical protein BVX98_01305 [bacterium F11]|nr:hypothetical protein BVX98_01305 [bacterium F11]
MYYELVFRSLVKNKVKFIVAGGMALNLHGIPRFTKDLDLLIDESKENLSRLLKTIKMLGYKPKVPMKTEEFLNPTNWPIWKKEKGMLALNLFNPKKPFEEIDLLVYSPITFQKARKSKKRIRHKTLPIDLVSLKDLIKMKKISGREQDVADIQSIKKLKRVLG